MITSNSYQPRVEQDLVEKMSKGPVDIAILYLGPINRGFDMNAGSIADKKYMGERAKNLEAKNLGPLKVTGYRMIFIEEYQGNIEQLLDGKEVLSIMDKSIVYPNGPP